MTRKKKLILLLALTVAFAAVFVLVAVFVPDNDATDENLVISDYDTVTAISWKSDKGSFEIRKNEDEKWYCTDNEDFPLSEDTALEMASAVKNITAIKLISENAENLSVYGLDNPSLTITAVYGDVTKEYKIGDYNEASGYNYFMHNGSQALYYVDSTFSSLFTKRLSDLAEYEYIQTIEAENVTDISLKSGEKEINITRYPEGTEGFDEEFIYFTQDMAPCDTEITESLIEGFVNVPWISCEAYSPDSQQLEDFGLSSPAAEFTISFTYSESEEETGNENMLNDTQTLLIGSTTGENDEYRYAMIKGGKCVYTLPEDTAEQYIISTGTELFSRRLLSFDITGVESVDIGFRGNTYSITAAADSEGTLTCFLDGKEAQLESFLKLLNDLRAESVQTSPIAGTGELLISATVVTTEKSTVMEIYEYDEMLCAVSLDGQLVYFADEIACDDIYDEFKAVYNSLQE